MEKHNVLTKRELIAAMAMQGMLANVELVKILTTSKLPANQHDKFLAEGAVEQADALLSALEKLPAHA